MFKNKIFNYFLSEFFKVFLLITLSLSILIWVTQAARLLELITELGNPISVYIKYLLAIYPKILSNIFLFCFTISMFFLFSNLESTNELQIYWLSGISKNEIIHACIKLSVSTMIIYFFLVIFFAPWSSLQGRNVLSNSEFSVINSLLKQNNFKIDRHLIYWWKRLYKHKNEKYPLSKIINLNPIGLKGMMDNDINTV